MINRKNEAEFPLKQEDEKAKASSSSSQWLSLKDPRIVRVSRAFGGKDRHSKVCTIRGLRDRRVRLSVPTAIHLYDLQDRLGLSQPSKVVDWLLNAAKHEIDELPPLPISPGHFTLGYNNPSLDVNQNTSMWKSKAKEVSVSGEMVLNCGPHHTSTVHVPHNYQWEPSAEVAQLGNDGFHNQTDLHSTNVVPFQSTLSLSSSPILVCPPGATQSYFPSHVGAMEMDPRFNNHFQMMSSSSQNLSTNPSQNLVSQSVKPFSLDRNRMSPKFFHSSNSSESQSHKDQDFPSN